MIKNFYGNDTVKKQFESLSVRKSCIREFILAYVNKAPTIFDYFNLLVRFWCCKKESEKTEPNKLCAAIQTKKNLSKKHMYNNMADIFVGNVLGQGLNIKNEC